MFSKKLTSAETDEGACVRAWVLQGLNNRRSFAAADDNEDLNIFSYNYFQRGCPDLVPQLRSMPVWSADKWTGELAWIHDLERMYPAIKQELLALKGKKQFQVSE